MSNLITKLFSNPYIELYEKEKKEKEELKKLLQNCVSWLDIHLKKQSEYMEKLDDEIFAMQAHSDQVKKKVK